MNKIGIYLLALTGAFSASAAPLVSIGDKVDIFFDASLSEQWNSNLYSEDTGEIDDYITTLSVGLTAEYGRDAKVNAKVGFKEDFLWYASESQLNNDLFSMFALANYAGDRYGANFNLSYTQLQQNSGTVGEILSTGERLGTLIRYDSLSIALKNSYSLTSKIRMELNIFYNGQYYVDHEDLYSDKDMYTIPLTILYSVTDKIDAGLTFQYRQTDFTGGASSSSSYGDNRDDYFMGLTVTGDLLPKLSAKIYFGGTYRVYNNAAEGIDNELTMAISAALNYALTDKVGTYLNISRDFGSGASRQSSIDTSVSIGASYAFSSFLSMAASFAYTNTEYQYDNGRTDDQFVPNISLRYSPIKNLSISCGYNYIANLSNQAASEYNRHLLSLSVGFRY